MTMEFVRRKKKGQQGKYRRAWFSAEQYRIVWRKRVHGVALPARYQAAVRLGIPHFAGTDEWFQMWDHVSKPLFKTLKAAQAACEQHYRLWSRACEATGIRELKTVFGRLPMGIPLWARGKLNRKVYTVLTEKNRCSEFDPQETVIPASSVAQGVGGGNLQSAAPPMEATSATGSNSTKKPSRGTKRKGPGMKSTSKPRGKNSPKKKSKRSGN